MRSIDGCGRESISVVVITIWLWILTSNIFWAVGVGRRRVGLLYSSIRIRLHVVIRIRFVIRSVWDNFWGILSQGYRSALPFINCYLRSYCGFGQNTCYQIIVIAIKYWLVIFTLPCSGVQIIMFNDIFRVWLQFAPCDWYIRYKLVGCEVAQHRLMKYLRLIGANFAYQIIIVR